MPVPLKDFGYKAFPTYNPIYQPGEKYLVIAKQRIIACFFFDIQYLSSFDYMNMKKLLFFLSTLCCFEPVLASHWEAAVLPATNFKYTVPAANIANWTSTLFNDAAWTSGQCGIGFGDGDDVSVVPNGTLSVYVRKTFTLVDTSTILNGIFNIDYDDGFVAYLNGTEICRNGLANASPAYNDPASQSHEAQMYQNGGPEYYFINQNLFKSLIRNGTNVLAIEVHNESAGSSDLSCIPFLNIEISNNVYNYSPTPVWFIPPITSSNLPLVIINTLNNQPIPNEPKIQADMKIIYNGFGQINYVSDAPNYQGMIGIEGRGAYSQSLPQKPYLLETYNGVFGNDTNVSLLGMPKENDWILQATYNDKTFLRNVLTFDVARISGEYATRTQHCEVIINGEYMGIYFLCEKIKVDEHRVNVEKLSPADNAPPVVTGGYIFKHDYSAAGWNSQWTSPNCPATPLQYQYYYPEPNDISAQQGNYLKSYVDSFETALLGVNFANPLTGFRKFIDEKSFIDYFLINEVSLNGDGFKKSMYFHKDRLKKLKAGPVWDFDWALKYSPWIPNDLSGYFHTTDPCSQDVPILFWWLRMNQDPVFVNAVKCRYNVMRAYALDTVRMFHYIDSMANYLNQAQARHYVRWPTLGTNVGTPENGPIPVTWAGEIERYKQFYRDRILWLDNNLPGTCNTPLVMPPANAIEFSELNYNSDSTRSAGDWVEIHNKTATPVNISGWQLQDNHIGQRYTVPANTILPANGYFVFANNMTKFSQQFPGVTNVLGPIPFEFSNSGETISLFTHIGSTAIEMTYSDSTGWPCTADGHGRTMELVTTGANPNLQTSWFDGCMGGSPGTAFSNCVENPLINEINYNSSLAADAGDWIEIHTKTNAAVNISGWKISDKNNNAYTFANGTNIPPYGYVTVYNDLIKFQSQYPSVPNSFGPVTFGLNNTKDVVKLFDNTGRVFQSVCYLSSAPYTPLPNGGGYSLQLIDSTGNLNKAVSWDRSCTTGTPGAKNLYPCGGSGLSAYNNDLISVYPNPTYDRLQIRFGDELVKQISIELRDLTGKIVFSNTYFSRLEVSLSLADFASGIYLMKIECDGKQYREKINKL